MNNGSIRAPAMADNYIQLFLRRGTEMQSIRKYICSAQPNGFDVGVLKILWNGRSSPLKGAQQRRKINTIVTGRHIHQAECSIRLHTTLRTSRQPDEIRIAIQSNAHA